MTMTRCFHSFLTKSYKQQFQSRTFGTYVHDKGDEYKLTNTHRESKRDGVQQHAKRDHRKKQNPRERDKNNHQNTLQKIKNSDEGDEYKITNAKKKENRQDVIDRKKQNLRDHRNTLKKIKNSKALKDLLFFLRKPKVEFRPSHISTCWNKASYFLRNERQMINNNPKIFLPLINHTIAVIKEFNARSLAITAHGIAKISSQTRLRVGRTLWNNLIEEAVKIEILEARDSSNMLWAFAKANQSAPELFNSMAPKIISKLDTFNSQDLANTVWAYARLGHEATDLFEAASLMTINKIETFTPQAMANTVWAYATLGYEDPDLFEAVSAIAINRLDAFTPQNISNTVWAYATLGHEATDLFAAISARAINKLDTFNSQAITNTVWAYATLGHDAPDLFEAISATAINKLDKFSSQDMANTVWAYATLGRDNPDLCEAVVSKIITELEQCNEQDIVNILWSLAVMNANTETVGPIFAHLSAQYQAERIILSEEKMHRLYQASLWFSTEHGENCLLPEDLREKCFLAFTSKENTVSHLKKDVVRTFQSLGYSVNEDVICSKTGYSIDAVIILEDGEVAVEVDGPSHFIGRKPTGKTILKHRQLRKLGDRPLLVVPDWEWNQMSDGQKNGRKTSEQHMQEKEEYLQKALVSQQTK